MKRTLLQLSTLLFCWLIFFAGSCNENSNNATQEQSQLSNAVGIHKDLDTQTFKKQFESHENALLIDVRTPQEVSEGFIKDAKNIDFNNENFMENINTLDKSQPIYIYCRSGGRSGKALTMMKEAGFAEVYNLLGGINGWKAAGNDILVPPQ